MNAPLHTASRIRELNDLFRTCFIGGRVLITEGITALGDSDVPLRISSTRS